MSLYYRKLNKKRALMIWKTNLRRLHKLNEDRQQNGLKAVEFDEKSIVKYAEKHLEDLKWNGRQIRNAFQTAIALADFEASDSAEKAPTMTKKHFAKLGKAAAEFDEYLESVHGMDEDKMARRDQERATFSGKSEKKRRSKRDSDSDDSDSSDESDSDSSSDSSSSESSDSDSDDSRAKSKKKKSKSKSSKSKSKDKKKQKQKDKASSGKSNKGGHAKDETTVDED